MVASPGVARRFRAGLENLLLFLLVKFVLLHFHTCTLCIFGPSFFPLPHSPIFLWAIPAPLYKSLFPIDLFCPLVSHGKFNQDCPCEPEFRTIHQSLVNSQVGTQFDAMLLLSSRICCLLTHQQCVEGPHGFFSTFIADS